MLLQEGFLPTHKELSEFLASVERRAYKQSLFAVHDNEAALDIVQDAMMKLAEKYSSNPAEELPMLFQRILQNTIRDWFRRQKVRSTWMTLFSAWGSGDRDDDEHDPLETLDIDTEANVSPNPINQIQQADLLKIIEIALEKLPSRQREAFLLRYWEDLDVHETARAMGCSEGSVKTHCSRATHTLAKLLHAAGISIDDAIKP